MITKIVFHGMTKEHHLAFEQESITIGKHPSLGVIAVALGVGVLGYHFLEGLSWIDALVNASMILGGMGPVNDLNTIGGKLFASFYALFSGLIFIFIIGLLLAPFAHRLLHRFHFEVDAEKD